MPKLHKKETAALLELIHTYRNLHTKIAEVEDGIASVEKQMKKLYKQKDAVIAQIQANREREGELIDELLEKYGKGKLNLENLEWINDEDINEPVQ